ncbi:MAG TPA: hypothetical protein VER78_01810 [Thermoanaerobaculia bacterium]|nr:hypothetical protein [Thermoanaerobaculia bacterium]
MIPEAGPALDVEVARRLGGAGKPEARYSTDPAAADPLIARLGRKSVFAACEKVADLWYCVLTADVAGVRQRIATGSGETQSLALCRAVAHLPLRQGPDPSDGGSPSASQRGLCQECGAALEKSVRSQARFCPVCAYRRGKAAHAAFERTRHSGSGRRVRPPAAGVAVSSGIPLPQASRRPRDHEES